MRVGRLVDRHVVDVSRQIGAVIQIVAAHQVLVGLALAAVQVTIQTGHGFQQLAHPVFRGECNSR